MTLIARCMHCKVEIEICDYCEQPVCSRCKKPHDERTPVDEPTPLGSVLVLPDVDRRRQARRKSDKPPEAGT